jgi:hypothetical protein
MALEISDQVLRLFPQVKEVSSEGDEALPYVFVGNLVDYLETQADPDLSVDLIQRVQKFTAWVRVQARGKDATDDVFTIFTVGFIEKLFESRKLHPLMPKLLSKEDLITSRAYLIQWVGEENFDRALALY